MDQIKGEQVIVQTHAQGLLLRRIWRAFPWAIEIVSDAQLALLNRGARSVTPIPFPPEDVYYPDARAVAELIKGGPVDKAWLRKWNTTLRGAHTRV